MIDTRNPNQVNKRRSIWHRAVIPFATTLLFTGVTYLYGTRVYDFVAARMFTPSVEVKAIHDELGLTADGSDLFYSSTPSVENSEQFNASCGSAERTAAILGCYYKRTIYIYNVTNKDLVQAKDVSAAHEMLHAAYERLNIIDRSRVDSMLQVEYAKQKNNTELKKLMDYYKQAEPEALTNELHSILGTTIASLSPELESYYSRYFNDRQKIVAMNTAYNSVFTTIESRANELSTKVDAMQPQLKADLASYNADITKLNDDIATFNTKVQNRDFTTQAELDTAQRALNVRVNGMNARRSDINAQVTAYNEYIAELKQLSVKVTELNNSINGIASPEASL